MRLTLRLVLTLLLILLVTACGNASPYQRRQRYQEHQAKRLAAADLEDGAGAGAWRAVHKMRVRVHAARAYRIRDSAWRSRFEEIVARANPILEQALGVKLEIAEMRDWDGEAQVEDIHGHGERLVALDPGEDVDWVIGLIGSTPRAELSFRELGEARMLGKHIVMRDMNDAEEQRAIGEAFDTLDEDARRRLYADRKRHKETVILLHEIAHTLGSIHVADPADIMSPSYDNRMKDFAEANVVLMRRVLAHRKQPEAERDDRALVDALAAYVRESPWDGWVAQERGEYLAKLQEAALALHTPVGAAAETPAAPGQPAAPEPGPESDVSALPEADRALFAQARADIDARKYQAAWKTIEPLAARHEGSYAVQHLACTLAMRAGLTLARTRQYCDRMSQLAIGSAAPQPAQPAPPR